MLNVINTGYELFHIEVPNICSLKLSEYGSYYYLRGMQVAEEHRQQGYGTLMIEAAKKIAWDVPIFLNVVVFNKVAVSFYVSVDFVISDEKMIWHNDSDILTMVWKPK